MRLAAVDLGSNSFHLEIAKVENDMILSEGSWKEVVRFAAGIDADGNLTAEAQDRALAALARIAEKIKGFPRKQVRAVGTQTMRSAHNSHQFVLKAEKVLGCPIEILSGIEEARLIYKGCSFALPASKAKRLIVDIGGGSTECVIGRKHDVMVAESFHVGCVNTTVRFFKNGNISHSNFHKALLDIESTLEGGVNKLITCGWDEAYGSSGTADAISEIMRASGWSDGTITLPLLKKMRDGMIKAGSPSKFDFLGLREDRREVLAGGVAVMMAAFEKLNITEMRYAEGALRYGLLQDLAGRKMEKDPRNSSVNSLLERLNADKAQAARTEKIAVALFKELNPEAEKEAVKELRWATEMHEVGLSVSRSDYHKHSAYLILNSEIPGFSRSEQEKLAGIVLGHRGSLKKVSALLEDRETADMIFCLRLAAILAHARNDEELPLIKLVAGPGSFTLSIPQVWLDAHPLSEYLIAQEKDIWAKVGFVVNFYGR
ncbi:MAG: Ppx/GppA family phosphatase [Burkholderiales bacterium]|nr:Ppx/GppA family phosphatase [Burkholderiales bacterium]